MGSCGEYGRSKSPQKENINCRPKSIYNRAKFLATKHLINLYRKKNFPVTILRLYQAYGPKQDINRLIPIVIDSCIKNKKFPCSNGKQYRDFIHVDDLVQSILKCFENKKAKGQIINIGTGKPKKIRKTQIAIIIIARHKPYLVGGKATLIILLGLFLSFLSSLFVIKLRI